MDAACDEHGRPKCKLHGLRMLASDVIKHLPLSSADSTNVAINIKVDTKWLGAYQPMTRQARAMVVVDRIEHHASAARWTRPFSHQHHLDLDGLAPLHNP